MKKIMFGLVLIAVLAAACGGPALQPTPLPTQPPPTSTSPAPTETHIPVDLPPAQLAAINALAEAFGIRVDEIKVVSVEAVQWPDSCLGISYPNARCAQAITPGFRIILEANGEQYEYHTNESGSAVASAAATLTWHREGGFAGFCDDLVVVVSGQAQAGSCAPSTAYPLGTLTDDELTQFKQWAKSFGSVVIEMRDPAVADAMTIVLTFSGNGSGQPTEADQQAMLNWAQSVYDRLKP
ncbi:MAG: hypothetical protein HYZ49_20855 [Chloroflexi bacterium]|nr:hypothetical protein [Chloroflexota bacterium]